jgi:hypothetical protein
MSDENQGADEAKPFWQSRTIIGAVVALVALFAGFRNVKIDAANLTDILVQVAGLVGTALAIWGRFQATQPIKFLGATTPGGTFNPKAEVKKASPISTPPDSSKSGSSRYDTLMLVALIFLLLGMALYAWPTRTANQPLPRHPVLVDMPEPEVISHVRASEWVKIIPVVDERPFFVRLWSSVRGSVTPALVHGSNSTSYGVAITKIEISGGADF